MELFATCMHVTPWLTLDHASLRITGSQNRSRGGSTMVILDIRFPIWLSMARI